MTRLPGRPAGLAARLGSYVRRHAVEPVHPGPLSLPSFAGSRRHAVATALHGACALRFRRRGKHGARHAGTVSGPPVTAPAAVSTAWSTVDIASLDTCT